MLAIPPAGGQVRGLCGYTLSPDVLSCQDIYTYNYIYIILCKNKLVILTLVWL